MDSCIATKIAKRKRSTGSSAWQDLCHAAAASGLGWIIKSCIFSSTSGNLSKAKKPAKKLQKILLTRVAAIVAAELEAGLQQSIGSYPTAYLLTGRSLFFFQDMADIKTYKTACPLADFIYKPPADLETNPGIIS